MFLPRLNWPSRVWKILALQPYANGYRYEMHAAFLEKDSLPRGCPRAGRGRYTGRAPEGKTRNRHSGGRLFANSVFGQIAPARGRVSGR